MAIPAMLLIMKPGPSSTLAAGDREPEVRWSKGSPDIPWAAIQRILRRLLVPAVLVLLSVRTLWTEGGVLIIQAFTARI